MRRLSHLCNTNKKRSKNFVLKTRYIFITRFGKIPPCWLCASSKHVDIHHLDLNWKNNSLENLVPLCRSCHRKYHLKIKPFSDEFRLKISKIMKGNKYCLGHKHSLKTRNKMRKYQLNRPKKHGLKIKEGLNKFYNSPISVKTRKAISESLKGNKHAAN